jgi:hypothetical protein
MSAMPAGTFPGYTSGFDIPPNAYCTTHNHVVVEEVEIPDEYVDNTDEHEEIINGEYADIPENNTEITENPDVSSETVTGQDETQNTEPEEQAN